jgi:Holliday junction resolvasome RuvABC ATP-dependent DNA helicase subunit
MSSIAIDINKSFIQDITLHTLIQGRQVKNILISMVDYFFAERASGNNPDYPMILLTGQTATTVAHAISNSFCNQVVHSAEGSFISRGVGFDEFLLQGDPSSTYYIHGLEKLNEWCKPELSRILNSRIVREPEKVGVTKEQYHEFKSLLICSTHNVDLLDDHLLDSFDFVCRLSEYNQDSVLQILKQRLKYMGWRAEPSVPKTIADLAKGDVKLAINVLKWTYRCSRSKDDDLLRITHLNTALHILR